MLVPVLQYRCNVYLGWPGDNLSADINAIAGCLLTDDRPVARPLLWCVIDREALEVPLIDCVRDGKFLRRFGTRRGHDVVHRLTGEDSAILSALRCGDNRERYEAVQGMRASAATSLPFAVVAVTDPEWDVRLAAARKLSEIQGASRGLRKAAIAAIIVQTIGDDHSLVRFHSANFAARQSIGANALAQHFQLSPDLDCRSLANRLRAQVHLIDHASALFAGNAVHLTDALVHPEFDVRLGAMRLAVRLRPESIDDDCLRKLWRDGGELALADILEGARMLGRFPLFLHEIAASQFTSETAKRDLQRTHAFLRDE